MTQQTADIVVIFILVFEAIRLIMLCVAMWKLFNKAGEQGWLINLYICHPILVINAQNSGTTGANKEWGDGV